MSNLDIRKVQDCLNSTIVGARLLYYPKVTSTMDVARDEASHGCPEGTVILAEQQTMGRGRFKRTWVSPAGINLYFSIVLYPAMSSLRRLTMATSLAVARGVADVCGLDATIKWPNDIRVNGKKLCGILLESALEDGRVRHAVVGVGLNVNFDAGSYPEIVTTATSLMIEKQRQLSRENVLVAVLQQIDRTYRALKDGCDLREPWRLMLETLGQRVHVMGGSQIERGLAEDVDDEGNLILLRDDNSRVVLTAGEVTLQT